MRQHRFLTSFLFLLKALSALGALLASGVTHAAVDETRLWLPPRTHIQLRPDLLAAAQFAEQSEECVEVLSGELDSSSAEDAPVFRIVCRNGAGFTYGVRVMNAGAPNAELKKVFGDASEEGAPSKSSAPGDNKSAGGTAPATEEETVLHNCEDALRRRTSGMVGVTIDMKNRRRITAPDGAVQYDIDFDAKDQTGAPLLFSATCHVGGNAAVRVELHPRQKTGNAPSTPTKQSDVPATAAGASVKAASEPAAAGAVPKSEVAPAGTAAKPQPDGEDGWEVVE